MKKIMIISAVVLATAGTALVASNVYSSDCPICPQGTCCPTGTCSPDTGDCCQK